MPAPDPGPPSLELLLETDGDAFADDRPEAGAHTSAAAWRPDHAFLVDWARCALDATLGETPGTGESFARAELSVRLVGTQAMRALNRDWRNRDAPTNVLSFPAGLPLLHRADDENADENGDGVGGLLVLGDVALCPAVIAAEAHAQGKRASDHWAHLVVHGVLHLRGLDHEDAGDARAMETLEARVLEARGRPDPYAPRRVANASAGASVDLAGSPPTS